MSLERQGRPLRATRNRRTAFLSATHRRRSRRSLSWYSLRKGADWMLPPSRSRFSVRLRKAEARSEARAPFDLVLGYLAGLAVAGAGFARAPIHAPSANGINWQSRFGLIAMADLYGLPKKFDRSFVGPCRWLRIAHSGCRREPRNFSFRSYSHGSARPAAHFRQFPCSHSSQRRPSFSHRHDSH